MAEFFPVIRKGARVGKKVAFTIFLVMATIFSFFFLSLKEVEMSFGAGLMGGAICGATHERVGSERTFKAFIGLVLSLLTTSILLTLFVFGMNPVVTGHPESLGILTAHFPVVLGYLIAFVATKKKKPHAGIFPPIL